MSKKIRLVRTMTTEYEPVSEDYGEGSTIEEMAELDASADDLESVFTELTSDEVKWQIVDEEGNVVSDSKKYRTRFEDGIIYIEFLQDDDSEWEEGRMSFNTNGLSLDQINDWVQEMVEIKLGK